MDLLWCGCLHPASRITPTLCSGREIFFSWRPGWHFNMYCREAWEGEISSGWPCTECKFSMVSLFGCKGKGKEDLPKCKLTPVSKSRCRTTRVSCMYPASAPLYISLSLCNCVSEFILNVNPGIFPSSEVSLCLSEHNLHFLLLLWEVCLSMYVSSVQNRHLSGWSGILIYWKRVHYQWIQETKSAIERTSFVSIIKSDIISCQISQGALLLQAPEVITLLRNSLYAEVFILQSLQLFFKHGTQVKENKTRN